MSTKAIQVAAKLYEARDMLKRLLGVSYLPKIRPVVACVKKIVGDGDVLKAGMGLIADMQRDGESGMSQMYVLAAIVELIEPSEVTP